MGPTVSLSYSPLPLTVRHGAGAMPRTRSSPHLLPGGLGMPPRRPAPLTPFLPVPLSFSVQETLTLGLPAPLSPPPPPSRLPSSPATGARSEAASGAASPCCTSTMRESVRGSRNRGPRRRPFRPGRRRRSSSPRHPAVPDLAVRFLLLRVSSGCSLYPLPSSNPPQFGARAVAAVGRRSPSMRASLPRPLGGGVALGT